MLASFVELALFLQRPSQRQMRNRAIGLELDHPLPTGDRFKRLFHVIVQLGHPLPDICVVGLELYPLLDPNERIG